MLEARRNYRTAVEWVHSARPRGVHPGRFAVRAFGGALAAGVGFMAILAVLAPGTFGRRRVPLDDPRGLVLLAILTAVALIALLAGRRLVWLAARVREPLIRPLRDHAAFDGIAAAVEACPAPLQVRFALAWVWLPVAAAVAGGTFAFSTAYFVVDAVLSRGQIGPGQALLLAINALAGLLVFRSAAFRLSTWRIAASAYRDATGRYAG
ncbi:MAG TPA: hypothetical protein VM573_00465 [Actinomycetota bacterium]|jgi:hypothetical protein|nr:hypothetical protein [Actinomycetota bacterium]